MKNNNLMLYFFVALSLALLLYLVFSQQTPKEPEPIPEAPKSVVKQPEPKKIVKQEVEEDKDDPKYIIVRDNRWNPFYHRNYSWDYGRRYHDHTYHTQQPSQNIQNIQNIYNSPEEEGSPMEEPAPPLEEPPAPEEPPAEPPAPEEPPAEPPAPEEPEPFIPMKYGKF